jgi:hypothetical protein
MEWKDRNKDRVSIYNKRARDKAYYFYRYGITNEEWLAIDVAQGGKCAICGVSGKLVVDHCHETDRVRGLLCQPCNKLLGNAKDREETLLAAIEYLRKT